MMYCRTPKYHSARPVEHADQCAGEDLDAEEAADLLVDVVHDLDRELLLRQRRSGDLHQLALEQVAGDQEEEDEEQDHRELPEERQGVLAAGPQVFGGAEGGLDDLHSRDTALRRRRV